jgi:hypothetical protein
MFKNKMLIPKHCADVSVINVGKGFSPEKTMEKLLGKPTFYLTKYVILRERDGQLKSGERASIIKLRTNGGHILKTIVGGEILAHPDKCLTISDPTIDEFILNQVALRAASARSNDDVEGIILSGRNENITFVYLPEQEIKIPLKILLVDTIPPKPSRLDTLTKISRDSRLISEHIKIESLNVDASEKVKETCSGGRVAFTPCPTEELLNTHQSVTSFETITKRAESSKPLLSIDLIGCSLSRAALNRLKKTMGLNIEVSLRDICPLHAARKVAPIADVQGFIVRCCKATESAIAIHINNKPMIILPWAPSLGDFVNAIDDLIKLVIGLDVA